MEGKGKKEKRKNINKEQQKSQKKNFCKNQTPDRKEQTTLQKN